MESKPAGGALFSKQTSSSHVCPWSFETDTTSGVRGPCAYSTPALANCHPLPPLPPSVLPLVQTPTTPSPTRRTHPVPRHRVVRNQPRVISNSDGIDSAVIVRQPRQAHIRPGFAAIQRIRPRDPPRGAAAEHRHPLLAPRAVRRQQQARLDGALAGPAGAVDGNVGRGRPRAPAVAGHVGEASPLPVGRLARRRREDGARGEDDGLILDRAAAAWLCQGGGFRVVVCQEGAKTNLCRLEPDLAARSTFAPSP